MPENIIHRRKSIHERETTPLEESDLEDEIILKSSSGSDEEYKGESLVITYEKNVKLKISSKSPLPPNKKKPELNSSVTYITPAAKTPMIWKCFPLLVILLALVLYKYPFKKEPTFCPFGNLQNEFPEEFDSTWKHLQYGVEMILNEKTDKPSVFLLAHHDNEKSSMLIEKLAQRSSKCFGKELIPMAIDDFKLNAGSSEDDYGHVIEKYKSKIKKGNVILIVDLNKIPAQAARALHAICDTHSPIRKNVVIFLTLTVRADKKGNANSVAEETLRELWGSNLEYNVLDPLITRVTDQVILLKS